MATSTETPSIVQANASSSSATNPALELDLLDLDRLPPLPSAWLRGQDLDLLEPLSFLDPTQELPSPAPAAERGELATALGVANAAYGHPRAEELAAKLADPATQVVVTGQQPGLWGGPLLGLDKMLAAIRWAEALEAAGRPAVAVFWVATEDHDWAEIARAALPTKEGAETLDLGDDPAQLMPMGMRTFGPGLSVLEERARELLRGPAPGLEMAGRWYRPDARFGEAFCRLLVAMLGERAPLMLDSMLSEVKQAEAPWMRRLVERRGDVETALRAREEVITERGHRLQVTPQAQASPLFLLRGAERRRILWTDDDHWMLRGLEDHRRPMAELLEILDENPAVISPGVLARPAIQDAMLGTAIQVMGPSEMSYMAQVSSVYPVLGLAPPASSLRPQSLVIENRQAEYLEELGIGLRDLFTRPLEEVLSERLAGNVVGPFEERFDGLMDELRQVVLEVDGSLEKPLRKTRDQMGRGLQQLASKVAAAVARKNEVWHRRLAQIDAFVRPGGVPQERVLSVLYYLDRFGPDFAAEMLAALDLDPRILRAVRLDPAPRDWLEATAAAKEPEEVTA